MPGPEVLAVGGKEEFREEAETRDVRDPRCSAAVGPTDGPVAGNN